MQSVQTQKLTHEAMFKLISQVTGRPVGSLRLATRLRDPDIGHVMDSITVIFNRTVVLNISSMTIQEIMDQLGL